MLYLNIGIIVVKSNSRYYALLTNVLLVTKEWSLKLTHITLTFSFTPLNHIHNLLISKSLIRTPLFLPPFLLGLRRAIFIPYSFY